MEAGVGVNSPEFLQKKIERLKTALEEANVLMDRHVTERDETRAQLDAVKRENADLKRELEEARAGGGAAPVGDAPVEAAPAIDPELENQLRARIAELEAERTALETRQAALETGRVTLDADRAALETERAAATAAAAGAAADGDQALLARVEALQAELATARQEAATARAAGETARLDADAARRDAESARATLATLPGRTESVTGVASFTTGGDLPSPGPFVSQEIIRDALDNDNFVLFCQPVFSLQSERVTQYELLLRLRDQDGRMVRPFGFLEPADRYGLMAEIDRWVVAHALDLLAADATGDLRLEVNIAGQTLSDPELTSLIEQQIAVTDLDPARLILEVSENVAAANLEACQRLAKRLRGLGCGFALDDFGSTFASFRHLRDLPINFLKIDGDLVVTVTESRTGQLTIKSLVELAKGLGAETIAEYVSDDQTLEFLREQGVGYAQGYRIGRPRPIDEVLGDIVHAHEAPPQPPVRVERPALESGDDEAGQSDDAADVTPSETT